MSYQVNQTDIYGFARSEGAEVKEKGKELFFKYCPYCHGGQHNDKNTFSINLENGTYKCFRSSCGKQGHFVELCRDFEYQLDFCNSSYINVKKPLGNYLKGSSKLEIMQLHIWLQEVSLNRQLENIE